MPWFNEEIKLARREKADRKWRRSGCREDMLDYKAKKNYVNQTMNKARIKFYQNFIVENNTRLISVNYLQLQKLCSIKATEGPSFLSVSKSCNLLTKWDIIL